MLDCPYLLLITESRAVSMICGYGIPKAAVIHKRGTQRPSSAAASRICHFVTVSKTVFSCGKENIRAAWFLCQKALLQAAFYAPKQ